MTTITEKLAPGSEAWLRLVSASKVAAICGVSPYDSPRSLWHKMRGDVPVEESTAIQRRGHYLEPAILAWWKDQHPQFVTFDEQAVLTRADLPWAVATPDLIAYDEDGFSVIVEAKSAARSDEWGAPGTDEIPTYYLTQAYWQLHMAQTLPRPPAVTYVPVLTGFLEFQTYAVEYDAEIGADLEARCAAFYQSLSAETPPALDDHLATFDVLKALHPEIERGARVQIDRALAVEYVSAIEDTKTATSRERAAKTAVLEVAGTAQYVECDGVQIARRQASRGGVSIVKTASVSDLGGAA